MVSNDAFIRMDVDHIAHVQHGHIALNGQCAGIFHGIEKDRCDFAPDAHAARPFIGDMGNVVAREP